MAGRIRGGRGLRREIDGSALLRLQCRRVALIGRLRFRPPNQTSRSLGARGLSSPRTRWQALRPVPRPPSPTGEAFTSPWNYLAYLAAAGFLCEERGRSEAAFQVRHDQTHIVDCCKPVPVDERQPESGSQRISFLAAISYNCQSVRKAIRERLTLPEIKGESKCFRYIGSIIQYSEKLGGSSRHHEICRKPSLQCP